MLYIGIDPGAHTGFAVWDSSRKEFVSISTLPLHLAFKNVLDLRSQDSILVIFEDARLRTWFGNHGRGELQGAGSIKRDCKIWEEFLQFYGIEYQAKKPTPGTTKWTPEHFARVTGWKGRTSEHARDAAILVYGR